MKIALIIDSINKIGGIEKATIGLANSLVEKKHDVSIITIYSDYYPQSVQYEVDSKVKVYSVSKMKFLKLPAIFYRLYFFFIKPKLTRILEDHGYDVVLYTNVKFAKFSKTRYKKLLILHSRFEYFFNGLYTKKLLDRFHDCFDKVVFLTKEDKDKYNDHYSTDNATYIYNGVPLQDTNNNDFFKKENIVVYVGRLDIREKQLDRAILMFEKAKNLVKEHWIFKIYGEGPDFIELKNMISEKNIQNIEFSGVETEMEKIFCDASINILSSAIEGLPMSIIEASSFRVPTISYNSSPGIQEIINDSISGYIVNMNDEDAFISRLKELMCDESKRNLMGKKAEEVVKRKFSNEKILSDWEIMLNALIHGD